ncbi:bridging integrator 3-like [Saccostrea echinata]|uniref:bridging integrator 3-like n=1 Tax=Saccostrea echinata TaxID=191078 RepID=UPI002A80F7CB|nr:bridging integrator 3-like [Saccostrea echinata]
MSWNPFNRHSAKKKSVVSRTTEREFGREVKRVESLDETSKKLYKDTKRWLESNSALSNSEHKITQDLLTSPLCQTEPQLNAMVTEWDRAIEKQNLHSRELNNVVQKTMAEPVKRLNTIFPSIQAALKKREQSLQEYQKSQAKVEKHQNRERTGQNVVKLDLSRKAVERTKADFDCQNQALSEDLPKFVDGRIEYIQPCLESLIKSQVSYNSEALQIYSELADQWHTTTDLSELKSRHQQTLSDIKALAITVD